MTRTRATLGCATALCCAALAVGAATAAPAPSVKTVFVIAMENHDWIQPTGKFHGEQQQIKFNPRAPFINSLVNGTATATINGQSVNVSQQVAYTDTYHNVLATLSGHNPSIHPSEPNYIWAEAGSNLHILNDNDPYATPPSTRYTAMHLATLLIKAGIAWKSYQEDTDLMHITGGELTNQVQPQSEWTVPLVSHSGHFRDGTVNAYNGHDQYSYRTKHNPQVFFHDTNGGDNTTRFNAEAKFYAPLQQLAADLASGHVATYNWITPNEFNDMHSWLPGGFTPPGGTHLTGDEAAIAQGDNFLRQVVPLIMASNAYQDGGVIVLWWDESEEGDNFADPIPEIVISPLAHPNVNGMPYDGEKANYSHSSDLLTWQEVFNLGPCLRDACNATDLSDLFAPGVIPAGIAAR